MGPNLTCACHCAHGVIEMHMCGSKGSAARSLEEKKGVAMQSGWVGDDKHKPRRGEGVVEANSEDLSGILVTLNKSSVVVKLIFFFILSLSHRFLSPPFPLPFKLHTRLWKSTQAY